MEPIDIRGKILDPRNPGDVQLPADASNTKYVLVQLSREMDNQLSSDLATHEASIIKRMSGNTWLLYYPPSDLRGLETIDGVEHAMVYLDEFVVHPSLQQQQDQASGPISVSVYLHENDQGTASETLVKIKDIANVSVEAAQGGVFHLEVNPQDLAKIASIDGVQAIEEIPEAVPFNNKAKELCGINSLNLSLPAGKSTLRGQDQCIGMADSGLDTNHAAFQHSIKKVVKTWYLKGIEDDDSGHGTHVAATILGRPVKCWQEQPIVGMAPDATLSVQGGIFRGAKYLASTLFEQAYNTPDYVCRIHNNSWGRTMDQTQAPYTTADAEKVDQWALAHPDFLILFAAGNDGLQQNSANPGGQVGAWAVAKNVLTVGATFSDRPFRDDYIVDYSVTSQRAKGSVSGLSSRGPVAGTQRTKPDIVAPGIGILSARASHQAAVQKQSSWPVHFGMPDGGYKDGDTTIFCSGTSMATPVVSGCAALLREALVKWQNVYPSAPLMKALLINGTDDLGQEQSVQGFGQINMIKVLKPVESNVSDIYAGSASSGYAQNTSPKGDTGTKLFKATISSPTAAEKKIGLQITLVYHDYQGDTIQNRLSLVVDHNGSKTDTTTTQQFENVHRVLLEGLNAGDAVSIGVSCGFLNNETPWAVVWNQIEV